MSEDKEFKQMIGEAIVSINRSLTDIRGEIVGVKQEVAGVKQEVASNTQELRQFRAEVNQKLDGIGLYLLSSDRTHLETAKRITLLENRVENLENEKKKDSA